MEEIPQDFSNKESIRFKAQDSIDSETEDEEVKFNCIGGLRGYQESDFSSDSDNEHEDEAEDGMEEQQSQEDGVVQFSCGRLQPSNLGFFIIRPKPERLSPHQEETSNVDDESSDSSEPSSVGARGAAISFGESNADRSSSDDDVLGTGDDDDSDDEAHSHTEEPSVLPQRSILHHLASSKYKSQPVDPQISLTNMEWKAKRVLSSNTLAALNAEAGRSTDSPKRMRTAPEVYMSSIDSLPELSLGLPAIDAIEPPPSRYKMRDDSPAISSDDDEELDRALSEELMRPSKIGGDSSPVPLLTPPQSPLTIPTDYGDVVEWPSNLVVDSAMMSAATITRPLSLSSLQRLEEEEEIRLKDAYSCPEPSSLTPLLRSIYVGID